MHSSCRTTTRGVCGLCTLSLSSTSSFGVNSGLVLSRLSRGAPLEERIVVCCVNAFIPLVKLERHVRFGVDNVFDCCFTWVYGACLQSHIASCLLSSHTFAMWVSGQRSSIRPIRFVLFCPSRLARRFRNSHDVVPDDDTVTLATISSKMHSGLAGLLYYG